MNKKLSRRAVFQGIFAAPFGAGLAGAQTTAELKVASRIIEVNGRAAKVFGVVNDEFEGEEYVATNKGEVYQVMNTIVEIEKIMLIEEISILS